MYPEILYDRVFQEHRMMWRRSARYLTRNAQRAGIKPFCDKSSASDTVLKETEDGVSWYVVFF
jgi:hypothetical protein